VYCLRVGIDQRTGTRLGGYELGEVLGRGGMGVVYRATHVHLGREVALKLLAPDLAEHPDFRERFLRESRLAASLDHPNVVSVYDAGDFEGTLYIAMRYIEGTDLAEFLRQEGPLEPQTVVTMLGQVAAALDAAHECGLIHRDVKPANVMIASGHCYLTDFGLTKRASASEVSAGLTQTGAFLGTVDYVAPEQIAGKPIDGRVDVYALACVLHECLTGARPYTKDSDVAVIYAHLNDPPPRPTELRPELPPAIDRVVATGMAKAPENRYSTCAELIDAASAALAVNPSGASPRGAERPILAPTMPGSTVSPRGPERPTLAPTKPGSTVGGDVQAHSGSRRFGRRPLIAGTAVLAVALIAIAIAVASGGSATRKPGSGPAPGVAATHTPTVTPSVAATHGTAAAQSAPVVGIHIKVGKDPIGIAGNSHVLWVANHKASTVTRVSLNGSLRTDIALPPGPFGVLDTGGTFWVTNAVAGEVTPISVATGLPGKPIHVGRHPKYLTGDENSVFVANSGSATVSVINARTAKPIGAPIRVGKDPQGIAFSGTAVWVADSDDDNVDRIVDDAVIKTIPVGPDPVGVAVGDNAVWVANEANDTVSRIDLGGQGTKTKTVRVGKAPFAIAFGEGSAWVTNSGDDTVMRLDAATGEPIGSPIKVGKDPTGIAVINGAVWVTNRGSDSVWQIKP
jgi:YVTN family beta-propeller protein